ncbi:MAG: mechanosensitive ion channel family protein [Candidatus Acidoferrales bacterium]
MPEDLNWRELLPTIIAVVGLLAVVWVGLWLTTRAIRRLAHRMGAEDQQRIQEIEAWAKQLTSFIRHAIEVVAGIAAVFILLRGLGIHGFPRLTWQQVAHWLTGPGLRILFVLGGAFVFTRILHLLIARLPMFVVAKEGPLAAVAEQHKRATTITRLLRMLTTVVVMSIAVLIVLREVGVDITPILTGAGIAGLAFGFGAQHLVRDVISGFFLIVEDQVRVGDVAIINGTGGLVEAIGLRTIVLRDLAGIVHVFPNGTINTLANLTKDYSFYVLDVGVAYKENVDHVIQVLKEIGEELVSDPDWKEQILGPLEVFGVDAFAESAVVIKARIKTAPIQQWNVGRELLRRIKNTFDAKGIEIPYPHVSVYFGEASKPFAVQVAEQLNRQKTR